MRTLLRICVLFCVERPKECITFIHLLLQAYGRLDRIDPTCSDVCSNSPFIILKHRVSGSYTKDDIPGFPSIDGVWDVQILINEPGRYAIRLEVDGVGSPVLFFEARSRVARLEIVTPAKTRVDGNASNPGDIFDVQPGNVIILVVWLVVPLNSLPNRHFL